MPFQVGVIIQGSDTKREPRLTPRIGVDPGSHRFLSEERELLKSEVPSRPSNGSRFSSEGSHPWDVEMRAKIDNKLNFMMNRNGDCPG